MGNSVNNWYALYTRPGCEKKVANLLSRKNIENYCPLRRHLNGRKKITLEPLFESYVFVRIPDATVMQYVRLVDSVVNFVYWLGKPVVIQAEEIEIMKRFMNEYVSVKLEKIPLDIDGKVKVIGIPTAESKVNLASVKNNMVRIILPSLGYMMQAEVEKLNVELITTANQTFIVEGKFQYAI